MIFTDIITVNEIKYSKQILSPDERYCLPGPNEVKFITNKQTLSLVLGSCISTVFIGKNEGYVLAANHIVIAKPKNASIIATKSAEQQIDEMLSIYEDVYNIAEKNILCFHLIGAGKKTSVDSFKVNEENIVDTQNILAKKGINTLFNDTRSHYLGSYSLHDGNLSIFIHDKINNTYRSFVINLGLLFDFNYEECRSLPTSGIVPNDEGFKYLVENNIVFFITGIKKLIV